MFKQKKFIKNLCATFILLSLLAISFTACSSSGGKMDKTANQSVSLNAMDAKEESFAGTGVTQSNDMDMGAPEVSEDAVPEEAPVADDAIDESKEDIPSQEITQNGEDENLPNIKLIWRANLELETLDYDKTYSSLEKTISEFGGFIESNSQNGGMDAFGNKNARYGSITARVPSQKLDDFLSKTSDLGNVTYSSLSSENITLQYADTEARKTALEAEYDKLLELMANASDINAVIAIEARLSEVRYQLDEFNSTLKKYDNLVDYSTVYIGIDEVEVISNTSQTSFSDRISNGFSSTFHDIKQGAEDFFVFIVVKSPIILIVLVIVFVIVKIGKKISLNKSTKLPKEKKLSKKTEAKEETKETEKHEDEK